MNHPSLATDHAAELYKKYFPKGAASIFTFEDRGRGSGGPEVYREPAAVLPCLPTSRTSNLWSFTRPGTTRSRFSGEELLASGIRPNTIRLSIGTEHIDDILADLEQGFAAGEINAFTTPISFLSCVFPYK